MLEFSKADRGGTWCMGFSVDDKKRGGKGWAAPSLSSLDGSAFENQSPKMGLRY